MWDIINNFLGGIGNSILGWIDQALGHILGGETGLTVKFYDGVTTLMKSPLSAFYGGDGKSGNSQLLDVLKMDVTADGGFNNDTLSQILNVIKNISDEILLPIAGLILAFILVKFIYDVVTKPSSNGEVTSWDLANIIFRISISILIVTHCWDFVFAIWHLGVLAVEKVSVNASVASVTGSLFDNFDIVRNNIVSSTDNYVPQFGSMFLYMIVALIVTLWLYVSFIQIVIAIYSRIISFLVYCAFAPIAFATILSSDWVAQIGQNYIKNIVAYALQGFMIMIILVISAMLPTWLSGILGTTNVGEASMDVMALVPYIITMGIGMHLSVKLIQGSQTLSKSMVGAQ